MSSDPSEDDDEEEHEEMDNSGGSWNSEEEEEESEEEEEGEGEEGEQAEPDVEDLEKEVVTMYNEGVRDMEQQGLADIGNLAWWTVSSFKVGHGVEQLRKDSPLEYWQSDGGQPHNIDVQFSKRVSLQRISLFVHFPLDESYTPTKIEIQAGTGYHDLQRLLTLEMVEPQGWTHMPLDQVRSDGVLKTFLVRFVIIANHQNGRDSHIRAIKFYSPEGVSKLELDDEWKFSTLAMLSETMLK
ncbi:anaphase-promoting complex subunit Doc1p [Trichomonascus vanleenenianus]|uniref:anaphase promoting complex subunit DOC1 n=1 Tax=Trichomonascus vanleenenianus TaxID=2268995 RepID=UPI003EC95741